MKTVPDPREALRMLGDTARAPHGDVLPIVASVGLGAGALLFGVDASGAHCALICVTEQPKGMSTFATDVFRCEVVRDFRLTVRGTEERRAALVLRSVEPSDFGDVFGALLMETVSIFDRMPTVEAWTAVRALLDRWSVFFRRSAGLSEATSLGLWGELKAIDAANDARLVVDAWRGGEGAVYDFFRTGTALEVKTGGRRGVHHVSHGQVASEATSGALLSLHAIADPSGDSLAALQARITERLDDTTPYYEALRRRGVTPRAIATCSRRWSLASEADVYALRDVPRIGIVPLGVSELSYKVSLDPSKRLDVAQRDHLLLPFGLDLKKLRGI